MQWLEIRLTVPYEASEAVAAVLQEWPEVYGVAMEGGPQPVAPHPEYGEYVADALSATADATVTTYVPETLPEADVWQRLDRLFATVNASGFAVGSPRDQAQLQLLEESSWEHAWKEEFHPIPVGSRLVIVPKWDAGAYDAGDRLPIILEPGMAFGTGTHATTQLCLQAMESVVQPGHRVADVGCGTAVLSIAAARLGASEVEAIDLDPVAVDVAVANVADNGVSGVVRVQQGELGDMPVTPAFDVIVANILRDIVIAVAPEAVRRLRAGGYLITSGFVDTQADAVRTALHALGLVEQRALRQDDWMALMAVKPR